MVTKKEMKEYLARENVHEVTGITLASTFAELGVTARVWSITAAAGEWWLVEGDGIPMCAFPKVFARFSADEAFSFHLGLALRVFDRHEASLDSPASLCRLGDPAAWLVAGVRAPAALSSRAPASTLSGGARRSPQ